MFDTAIRKHYDSDMTKEEVKNKTNANASWYRVLMHHDQKICRAKDRSKITSRSRMIF